MKFERHDEDEDDYWCEDDHFENISENNASHLEDEDKEWENEALKHNQPIQLRRSSRISSKNLGNRMSCK